MILGIQLYGPVARNTLSLEKMLDGFISIGISRVEPCISLDGKSGAPSFWKPEQWENNFDSIKMAGLDCISCHISALNLSESFPAMIELADKYSIKYFVVGTGGTSEEEIRKTAEVYCNLADALCEYKAKLLVHNGKGDIFAKVNGKTAYEYLIECCDGKVGMQFDTGWAARGGEDPGTFIEKNKEHIASLHFKDFDMNIDSDVDTCIGEGTLDNRAFMDFAVTKGIPMFIDADTYDDVLADAGKSYTNLKKLDSEKEWAAGVLTKICEKMDIVTDRSRKKIPYTTVNGVHDDRSGEGIGWWTNGFWGGILWQLYNVTGNKKYEEMARELEKKLDVSFLNPDMLDHDNGFKWLPTAVANYRLNKEPASRNRGILAADNLAGRFNSKGRFIRAWNDWDDGVDRRGWAIIDCMMNLPLLYWASEETNDPRYRQIAAAHADTAMKSFIRENGSSCHIVEFDVDTGERIKSHGGQGIGHGSSWTRGQAWGLYGFTLSYIHTNDENYLRTAEKIADYFISHIRENGFVPVDFDQAPEISWEDSTAAVIAACGMLEMSNCDKCADREKYRAAALRLLHKLEEERINRNQDEDDLLQKCTAAYNDKNHEFSIIYGDYFFIEAIGKIAENSLMIW